MCSNFDPIQPLHSSWVTDRFGCQLPSAEWRAEAYPTYPAPFIHMKGDLPSARLAEFGLVPFWAAQKKRYGVHTYNARSETVAQKPSFQNAWKSCRFGIVLVESFYEPKWIDKDTCIRYRIKRSDGNPTAIASLWEEFTDKETGEIRTSFCMLTVNATDDPVMKHFHRPEDEKRSVVVLTEDEYIPWFTTTPDYAPNFLDLAPDNYLVSEPAPKMSIKQKTSLL